MKYVVVIIPEKNRLKIRELMKQTSLIYGNNNALRFPPHITLRGIFQSENIYKLIKELRKELKNFESFKIKIGKPSFYEKSKFFLEVQSSGLLQQLHEKIVIIVNEHRNQWLPNLGKFHGLQEKYLQKYGSPYIREYYKPTITLANGETSEKNFLSTKNFIAKLNQKFEDETVDKITLFSVDDKTRIESFISLKTS